MPQQTVKCVVFQLGDQTLAISVLKVWEILKPVVVTALPNMPERSLGIINLRTKLIPIFDLPGLMGLPKKDETNDTVMLILDVKTSAGTSLVGTIVDKVIDVLPVTPDPVTESNQDQIAPYRGVSAKIKDKAVTLLDPNLLFTN